MSIQLKTEARQLCTLALSFNNDGPLGTTRRYIGDSGTYVACYDDLVNGKERRTSSGRGSGRNTKCSYSTPVLPSVPLIGTSVPTVLLENDWMWDG